MSKRKKRRRGKTKARIHRVQQPELVPVKEFLESDAIHHFTTIYLHDVAYHVRNAQERAAFVATLREEPEEVRDSFVQFAQSYREPAQRTRRMGSFITFSRRALGYETRSGSDQTEETEGVAKPNQ